MKRPLAVAAALLSLVLVGEGVWACWAYVPLSKLVSDSDVIVIGKIVEVETGESNAAVGTIEVQKVIKGKQVGEKVLLTFPAKAVTSASVVYRKGQDGVWLLKEHKERKGYYGASYPARYQPVGTKGIVELLAAGKTDAGAEIVGILKEADWQTRSLAIENVCGPVARKHAAAMFIEWITSREGDRGWRDSVRSAVPKVLAETARENADLREKILAALMEVLEREPKREESPRVFAQAFTAATAIAHDHFAFPEKPVPVSNASVFDPDYRYFGWGGGRQAFEESREKCLKQLETLRAWWERKHGKGDSDVF